jgi:hypothetical protein
LKGVVEKAVEKEAAGKEVVGRRVLSVVLRVVLSAGKAC